MLWGTCPTIVLPLFSQAGEGPLFVASKKGHFNVVEVLLGAGAAIDQVDKV